MTDSATTIDLNVDLGEGFGRWSLTDDAALLDLVSSANVACGFHAGDPSIMRRTCEAAAGRGVRVGAHVAYRDLAGFGRRFVDATYAELRDDVLYQVGALDAFARAAGTQVSYVKPHGALYNAIVHHEEQARAVVDAVAEAGLALVGLPGSVVLALAAEAGVPTIPEAFADRGYRADGTLVPRREPGALVTDPDEVAARVVRLAREGTVLAVDGTVVASPARSVCVHSDTPGAPEVVAAVRSALDAAGVAVVPAV
ncbi:UPF0271 protein [Luteimicrobium album]|uniref:5-oxoprolinase subunit A n=1 Tax=Luteimicrobium album TaxID=1054550 RepID=A0ABQ6I518_9MICO|nr:5-oxoprolinase subunit PxpA [Luteimicrobium album]GMA25307.1 UPF0271 protein [Luteimicrobium album]